LWNEVGDQSADSFCHALELKQCYLSMVRDIHWTYATHLLGKLHQTYSFSARFDLPKALRALCYRVAAPVKLLMKLHLDEFEEAVCAWTEVLLKYGT
jgi:hypothetical protein